jgi:hypothetical protein
LSSLVDILAELDANPVLRRSRDVGPMLRRSRRLPVMDKDKRLAWVIRLEEAQDALRADTAAAKDRQAQLYALVREAVAAGMPQTEIGGVLGLKRQRISQIVLAEETKEEET